MPQTLFLWTSLNGSFTLIGTIYWSEGKDPVLEIYSRLKDSSALNETEKFLVWAQKFENVCFTSYGPGMVDGISDTMVMKEFVETCTGSRMQNKILERHAAYSIRKYGRFAGGLFEEPK